MRIAIAALVVAVMAGGSMESAAQSLAFEGGVFGPGGRPLQDATVAVYRQGSATTRRTAADGQFRIDLAPGGQIDYIVFEHAAALPRVIEGPLAIANSRLVVMLSPRQGTLTAPEALAALHAAQFMRLVLKRTDVPVPAARDIPEYLKAILDSIGSAPPSSGSRRFNGQEPKENGLWPMDDVFLADLKATP